MVISRLIGGLGNQMFQYAAGRALSLEGGTCLRLDISDFLNYQLHQGFELPRIFNCTVEIANQAELREVLSWQYSPFVRRVVSKPSMFRFRRAAFVIEPHYHYWSDIHKVHWSCYLMGYWQSEKYFSEVAQQIRKDFSFRLPLENQNVELAQQIDQTNSVSLHVRRGDYVNNPANAATYQICSLDYYQKAIRYIAKRVQQPHFFIFSDDIVWVKNNLKLDFAHHYVDCNHGVESYNDMRLMSLCKHHIIANSSFSWWGAWLNARREKIVVAPKKWFFNQSDMRDLLPQDWVKL